jgi:hypothetical protein
VIAQGEDIAVQIGISNGGDNWAPSYCVHRVVEIHKCVGRLITRVSKLLRTDDESKGAKVYKNMKHRFYLIQTLVGHRLQFDLRFIVNKYSAQHIG